MNKLELLTVINYIDNVIKNFSDINVNIDLIPSDLFPSDRYMDTIYNADVERMPAKKWFEENLKINYINNIDFNTMMKILMNYNINDTYGILIKDLKTLEYINPFNYYKIDDFINYLSTIEEKGEYEGKFDLIKYDYSSAILDDLNCNSEKDLVLDIKGQLTDMKQEIDKHVIKQIATCRNEHKFFTIDKIIDVVHKGMQEISANSSIYNTFPTLSKMNLFQIRGWDTLDNKLGKIFQNISFEHSLTSEVILPINFATGVITYPYYGLCSFKKYGSLYYGRSISHHFMHGNINEPSNFSSIPYFEEEVYVLYIDDRRYILDRNCNIDEELYDNLDKNSSYENKIEALNYIDKYIECIENLISEYGHYSYEYEGELIAENVVAGLNDIYSKIKSYGPIDRENEKDLKFIDEIQGLIYDELKIGSGLYERVIDKLSESILEDMINCNFDIENNQKEIVEVDDKIFNYIYVTCEYTPNTEFDDYIFVDNNFYFNVCFGENSNNIYGITKLHNINLKSVYYDELLADGFHIAVSQHQHLCREELKKKFNKYII